MKLLPTSLDSLAPSPVVVGGMGGSGTRVVARILRRTGRYMGRNINVPQEDALDFAEFDYRWIPPFLASLRTQASVTGGDRMHAEFNDALRRFLDGRDDPDQPWGWKHSPSVHLLSFLDARFEDFLFVHVIRDGRDIALGSSGGRTHTLRLGRAVLDEDPAPVTPDAPAWKGRASAADGGPEATPLRQIQFWGAVHTACADYTESEMPGRYYRLRLEDLCRNPVPVVDRLLDFVGCAENRDTVVAAATSEIAAPSTLGRWRTVDSALVAEVTGIGQPTLQRFGYLDQA